MGQNPATGVVVMFPNTQRILLGLGLGWTLGLGLGLTHPSSTVRQEGSQLARDLFIVMFPSPSWSDQNQQTPLISSSFQPLLELTCSDLLSPKASHSSMLLLYTFHTSNSLILFCDLNLCRINWVFLPTQCVGAPKSFGFSSLTLFHLIFPHLHPVLD